MSEARRYAFGPPEDRSLVAGLRGSQLAIVVTVLVLAVSILRSAGDAAPPAIFVLVVVGAGLAFWSVGGRTLHEWAPIVAAWGRRRASGGTRYRSALPLLGLGAGEEAPLPPPALAGVRILAAAVPGGEVGVVHDRRAGTYAAALAVRGGAFQLADLAEKERRLATWGALLAGLARSGSPLHRLQWVDRTVPDDGDAMGQYLAAGVAVPPGHPTLASYLELVDAAGPITKQHETFLVVMISAHRASRAIRQAGGGDAGAVKVLLREVASLGDRLLSADVTVEGVCSPRLVAGALRVGFEPQARRGLARRAAASGEEGGTAPRNAWPLAADTRWDAYHVAGAWHATYWIAHWPRTPMGADFLAPLLLGTESLRTVAVTMEPIDPARAHREVEQAMVKGMTDDDLRDRGGFVQTARRRRERESVERRESELADGHRDYRLSGYVTVTAMSSDELEAACGEIEQQAQQSALELRRLYGEQDVAFTCTLPLGRGLR